MRKPLIIAYGNPLRQDDGVAWRAVDLLESRLPPGLVETCRCHQLTPELAASLEAASLVLLLDAKAGSEPGEVEVNALSPDRFSTWSHDVHPRQLLAIARDLFAVTPPAFLITATVSDFGFDDHITKPAEHAAELMAARAAEIVREIENSIRPQPRSATNATTPG